MLFKKFQEKNTLTLIIINWWNKGSKENLRVQHFKIVKTLFALNSVSTNLKKKDKAIYREIDYPHATQTLVLDRSPEVDTIL